MSRSALAFLTLIVMGVYWNTLANDFVAGDRQFILRNPDLGNYQAVQQSFFSDYWGNLGGESFIYYRPITIVSHFIDVKLYGLHPAGHHFSNMALHAIVTLLVYRLFICLFPACHWAALTGSGLFALHPIHTHSVAYVMGRTDILATLFYLWSLLLLIGAAKQHRRLKPGWRIVGACLCYFLALLCKEIAVTLPAVFILYWFLWKHDHHAGTKSGFWFGLIALCLTLGIYLFLRITVVGLSGPAEVLPAWYSLWQRVGTVFITCGFYVWKLCLPFRLCYYSNIVIPGSWAEVIGSPFFWLSLMTGLFFLFCWRRVSRVSFALGWIGVSLLPVLNIIPITTLAKENYLYLPSIGFCLLFSLLVYKWWQGSANTPGKYRTLLLIMWGLISLLYASATVRRNTDYRDPIIFLKSTLKHMAAVPVQQAGDVRFFEGTKNFYVAYRNLGLLYQERGQWQEAAQSFENALRYTPSYFSPKYESATKISLGTVYEKMGMLSKAFQILQEARPLAVSPSKADNLLGVLCAKMGQKEQAEFYFTRAIQEEEAYAPAHLNLGILYMQTERPQKGLEELSKAVQLSPKYKEVVSRYGLPTSFQKN